MLKVQSSLVMIFMIMTIKMMMINDDYHNANNKSFLILVVEKLDSRAAPGASSPSKPQGLPARVTIIIILIKTSIISNDSFCTRLIVDCCIYLLSLDKSNFMGCWGRIHL